MQDRGHQDVIKLAFHVEDVTNTEVHVQAIALPAFARVFDIRSVLVHADRECRAPLLSLKTEEAFVAADIEIGKAVHASRESKSIQLGNAV
ncbi:hypothetical protein D9M72_569860 [compost metagenome]